MTYCKLLTKDHGRIDWHQNADEINQQIRGLNPWPGTWCLDDKGKRLKIIDAVVTEDKTDKTAGTMLEGGKISCESKTILQLITVQPENKKAMSITDVLNGGGLSAGSTLA